MSREDLSKLILLIAGLLAFVASSLIDSGDTTQATLEWVRGHHTQAYIAALIGLMAVPFYLAGVVTDWLSMRDVDARLALLATVSFTVGYVGLAAIDGSQGLAYALAADETIDLKNLAATMDSDKLPLVTEQVLAFGGWIGGILALAVLTVQSSSRLATLGLLSVPFALAFPAVWSGFPADEVAGVLFLGGAALWTIPILRNRSARGT